MRTDILRCTALVLLLAAGCNKKQPDDMTPPLHWAVIGGDVNEVRLLLRQGADINAKDSSGRTPLFIAASGGKLWSMPASLGPPGYEMVRFLLDNGANINARDKWGYSVLHGALNKGRTDVAELLLARGAYVKTQSQGGETPLHVAARDGWPKLVKLLIAKGAEVNMATRNGDTPLLCAVFRDSAREYDRYPLDPNHLEVVRLLIAKGADVNAMNRAGDTALSYAAQTGDLDLARLLMDSGARPNLTATPDGAPAILAMDRNHLDVAKFLVAQGADVTLHLAAYVGDLERARALIQGGNQVDERWSEGRTPLHMAACTGQRDIAELLISRGADVNAQDEGGWTPLHVAAWSGHENVVETLIARGAAVNARTLERDSERDGRSHYGAFIPVVTTPLHLAVKYPKVVKVLVANGADINAKDEHDETPIDRAAAEGDRQVVDLLVAAGADISLPLAAEAGHLEKVKQLISAGTDVNARDKNGSTALCLAIRRGHADVVEALISSGADVNAENRGSDILGQAPLHTAARLDDLEIARILIAHGADIGTWDPSHGTALHIAAYSGSTSVVEMLLSHGADPNARTEDGRTALDFAKEAGFRDIIRLLGGDVTKAASGPYRATVTDANAIQSFLGRTMSVDEVWTPNDRQLKELDLTLKTYLRDKTTWNSEYDDVLRDLGRFHREYAGFIRKGKRYIVCNLFTASPDEKPLANGFSGPGRRRWGLGAKVIFNVDNKAIVRIGRF
jgi:cytohesin